MKTRLLETLIPRVRALVALNRRFFIGCRAFLDFAFRIVRLRGHDGHWEFCVGWHFCIGFANLLSREPFCREGFLLLVFWRFRARVSGHHAIRDSRFCATKVRALDAKVELLEAELAELRAVFLSQRKRKVGLQKFPVPLPLPRPFSEFRSRARKTAGVGAKAKAKARSQASSSKAAKLRKLPSDPWASD